MHENLSGSNEVTGAPTCPVIVVTRISEGLSFGEGAISASGEDERVLELMDTAIHGGPEILVPVETEDDGCSDGRPAISVFRKRSIFKHNHHRAKIFGGAVVMTAASKIGLGENRHQELPNILAGSIDTLVEENINFGAHIDEAAHGENCGCGAIDRGPDSLWAAVKYENEIRQVIAVLGVETTGLDEVQSNFRQYVNTNLSQPIEYSGRKVMDKIVDTGKIVKKLGGEHRERRIILNQVRGFTVNQRLIRAVTDGEAQVFGVDTWRLEDVVAKLYPAEPERQHKAVLSMLVYTLGTAAVLTKGDLPIDIIEEAF